MKQHQSIHRRDVLCLLGLAGLALGAGAEAWASQAWPALTHWSQQQLRLVVKYQQNPLRAARAMAYVQQALLAGWRAGGAKGLAPALAHAHHAAATLLARLYPNETPGQFRAQAAALSALAGLRPGDARQAEAAGEACAQPLLERSLRDGAGRVWSPAMRPPAFDGMWQPSPPLHQVNPAEGMAPHWRTWLAANTAVYQPPTAPRPGQPRHTQELREVLEVARGLRPDQAAAAQHWHLDAGSLTPPGLWLRMALDALGSPGAEPQAAASIHDALHALALLATAMHDALVHAWRIKLRDWSERPVTAIRRSLDPDYMPLLVTPGFPAYVSGHAAVSGAAAEVLAARLPNAGQDWHAHAEEATMSRLWGGIHFRSDNEEGLRLGRSIGQAMLVQAAAARATSTQTGADRVTAR